MIAADGTPVLDPILFIKIFVNRKAGPPYRSFICRVRQFTYY
jgi:hypothetical protein